MLNHFQESESGYLFDNHQVSVFFGKSHTNKLALEKEFYQINFLKLRQLHSDKVVQASSQNEEADAHWTQEINTGLVIATADCIPVLILNTATKKIAAVHAGWKGVCNQITMKTLRALSTKESTASDFIIWIGPHIALLSFEVQADVLQLLLNSSFEKNKHGHYLQKNNQFFVDLKSIVLSQINEALSAECQISELPLDTKTNNSFNSYRRDRQNSGRNLSFISLK